MSAMLGGATVLVAGAGPGLGQEIAVVARREGASVVLGARRSEMLDRVAAAVEATDQRRAVPGCKLEVELGVE